MAGLNTYVAAYFYKILQSGVLEQFECKPLVLDWITGI
jgi:hypothetical protein